jgi:single-strand DNA-binding protein
MYKITLIGNLTKDPEVRTTTNGTTLAEIRIACTVGKEKTLYETVTLWEKDAELAAKWLTKGKQVYVEAEGFDDSWVDKEGNKKEKKGFNCRLIKFLGKVEKDEKENNE